MPLYYLARALIVLLQSLPLTWVARLGRCGGAVAYRLDGRHRRMARLNLTRCFGAEKSAAEIEAIARENFRRIGENFACAAKTASMTLEEIRPHIEFVCPPELMIPPAAPGARPIVAAIGHFGNFELYARFGQFAGGRKTATTYRGLRQASLNRLLQSLRERSGCEFFERRFDGAALKSFMHQPGVVLGLLSDQHGGQNGLQLPFLGHDCSTMPGPAIFALRYHAALYTGVCYRVGLARWRIEAGAEIPTHRDGAPRPVAEMMLDINRAFEAAVHRDPANWFWVHNRWKMGITRKPRAGDPAPKTGAGGAETPAGPR